MVSGAQLRLLRAWVKLESLRGFAPSLRELQAELGFASHHAVADCVGRLERDGLVVKASRRLSGRGRSRAWQLTPSARLLAPAAVVLPELRCAWCNAARFGVVACPMCGQHLTTEHPSAKERELERKS